MLDLPELPEIPEPQEMPEPQELQEPRELPAMIVRRRWLLLPLASSWRTRRSKMHSLCRRRRPPAREPAGALR
jgi:hypothetical protein